MEIPVQVTFRNMDASPAIEENVRNRAQRLARFQDRIVNCRVVIEAPHRHHHKGHVYTVSIDLSVPGHDVAVSRDPQRNHAHEDVYVAIRDAFNAAARQLEDKARRMRGDVKTHEVPLTGTITRLFPDEGYGFITMADLGEVYFHENSLVGARLRDLELGSEVRVEVAEGESPHGLQASTVHPIGKHHPTG